MFHGSTAADFLFATSSESLETQIVSLMTERICVCCCKNTVALRIPLKRLHECSGGGWHPSNKEAARNGWCEREDSDYSESAFSEDTHFG
eukprot:6045892-Amphidinium_carterae.1